jgi:hypothetical protein
VSGRQQLEIKTAGASPEEAAAVVAALEQFLRDTAPAPVEPPAAAPSAWKQAALAEGVARRPQLTR